MTNRRTATYLEIFLIIAAVFACYSNCFHGPFLFDDLPYIQRNGNLRSWASLGELWSFAPTRFLTYFSLFLNFQLSGLDVFSYHLVNVLIHISCALLVYFLVRTLLTLPGFKLAEKQSSLFPFAAGFLFAVHPVQTEAVTYIWQRSTSLTAFFYLASLLCYLRTAKKGKVTFPRAAFFLALLAMFTKQISATLPLAILLIEYLGLGWKAEDKKSRIKRLYPMLVTLLVIPLTLLIAGDYDWREIHTVIPTAIYIPTRLEYLLTEINVLRDYYRLLFFPLVQNVDYDVPFVHSLASLVLWLSLGLHLAVISAAIKLRRKLPTFTFGVLFFYLALAVESSLVPLADVEFEHRLYLPSFGFLFAALSLVHFGFMRWKGAAPRYAVLLTLIVITGLPLGWLTWQRNLIWTSTKIFWKDAALKSPNKSRPLTSYARVISEDDKNKPEAIQVFEKALKIDPRNTMAALSLSLLYENSGDWVKAFRVVQQLGKVSPQLPEYLYALAGMFLLNHQEEKGVQFLKKAVSKEALDLRSPDNQFVATQAFTNLMNLALQKNELNEVIWAAKKLLEYHPEALDVRTRLAYALARKGDNAGAVDQYMTILEYLPGDFETLNNLAVTLEDEGKIDQASAIYDQMIRAKPSSPAPQINQILLLASNGHWEKAAQSYKHLPALGDEAAKFYSMMGRTFFDKGRCDLAVDSMNQVLKRASLTERPLIVEMHSKLAECYGRQGDRSLASEHAQEAKRFAR